MRKRTRDGYHFGDDPMVEDGERVHVPMMLCDGHRNGYLPQTDEMLAKRRAARDGYVINLGSAWCDGGRIRRRPDDGDEDRSRRENAPDSLSTADAQESDAVRRGAYYGMVARAANAWCTPVRDFAQPDQSSTPAELARHLRTDPNDDAQARRDRAWIQYRDNLASAWKTDPRAATAIERQAEMWRAGR